MKVDGREQTEQTKRAVGDRPAEQMMMGMMMMRKRLAVSYRLLFVGVRWTRFCCSGLAIGRELTIENEAEWLSTEQLPTDPSDQPT